MKIVKPFRFKQFEIFQDKTAMKIGTDGVLLGAWAKVNNTRHILDIGTGTGVVALMLAQRFPKSKIDAVEIEEEAFNQAKFNFNSSKWKGNFNVFHCALQSFNPDKKYDLIVSNPPFFEEKVLPKTHSRQLARYEAHLKPEGIFLFSSKYLIINGLLNLIYPKSKEIQLINTARDFGFYPHYVTYVKGNLSVEVKRILVAFGKKEVTPKTTTLIIEKSRHNYTEDYIKLTKDFYLKM